jgi:rhodanese-related sulfurtransferase
MLDYEISPAEASVLHRDKKARLLDVREPWEVATAQIEGSITIPMADLPSRVQQELDPDERIVVFCHAGVRSMNVTAWLREQGFEQVQSMRGGIDAWSTDVDPSLKRY